VPVEALLTWYHETARDLPWRRTTDPYAILVSEVMLQQTQVARVIDRYLAWLERWPTAQDLAAAPLPDVLAAWVGLGYNRRAVRLREACRVVARDGWPEDLRDLPGVGPYTAAAVGSFAFGRQEVAVDVNVARVCSRLGLGTASELVPVGRAAEFNQAMMELGAVVCRARVAACPACPVARWCSSAGAVPDRARTRPEQARERFEDSNRWVRGRIVAALARGGEMPGDIAADRVERAVQGLLRDGLVTRDGVGLVLAPGTD
jgi:A/G-specific adenine glycosylase